MAIFNEELEEELEILVAMYGETEEDNLTVEKKKDASVFVSIVLNPSTGGDEDMQFVRLEICVRLPPGYPQSERPILTICSSRGLDDAKITSLHKTFRSIAEENVGEMCIIEIFETLRDTLTEYNESGTCSICLEDFTPEQMSSTNNHTSAYCTPCFHLFHVGCFGRWAHFKEKQWETKLKTAKEESQSIDGKRLKQQQNEVRYCQKVVTQLESDICRLKRYINAWKHILKVENERDASLADPNYAKIRSQFNQAKEKLKRVEARNGHLAAAKRKLWKAKEAEKNLQKVLESRQSSEKERTASSDKFHCPCCRVLLVEDKRLRECIVLAQKAKSDSKPASTIAYDEKTQRYVDSVQTKHRILLEKRALQENQFKDAAKEKEDGNEKIDHVSSLIAVRNNISQRENHEKMKAHKNKKKKSRRKGKGQRKGDNMSDSIIGRAAAASQNK